VAAVVCLYIITLLAAGFVGAIVHLLWCAFREDSLEYIDLEDDT